MTGSLTLGAGRDLLINAAIQDGSDITLEAPRNVIFSADGAVDVGSGNAVVGRKLAEDLGLRLGGKLRLEAGDGRDAVVNVAGIMGDASSGVSETTTDLFIECAHFEPPSIRATRKALGVQSDAAYRFERFVTMIEAHKARATENP